MSQVYRTESVRPQSTPFLYYGVDPAPPPESSLTSSSEVPTVYRPGFDYYHLQRGYANSVFISTAEAPPPVVPSEYPVTRPPINYELYRLERFDYEYVASQFKISMYEVEEVEEPEPPAVSYGNSSDSPHYYTFRERYQYEQRVADQRIWYNDAPAAAVDLTVSNVSHAILSGNVVIDFLVYLDVQEIVNAHSAENLDITQVHVLVVSDSTFEHLATDMDISPYIITPSPDRTLIIRMENRLLVIVAEDRTLDID